MRNLTLASLSGILLLLVTVSGCCRPNLLYPIALDGNYKGRVVEEQTREPIEGVVVTAVWYYVCATMAGGVDKYYDAYETVTDEHGNFTIPGKGIRFFIQLDEARVYIFKAGYSYFRSWWRPMKRSDSFKERIAWEGRRAIIPLRKLTDEEVLRGRIPTRPIISPDKTKLLTIEINKVRVAKGFKPLHVGEVKE